MTTPTTTPSQLLPRSNAMASLTLPPTMNGYGRVDHPVSGILLNRSDDIRPTSPFRPRGGSDDRGRTLHPNPDVRVNLVTPNGEEHSPGPHHQAHATIATPPAIPGRSHSPHPTSSGVTAPGVHSPRIRFAPLPEPRPRSLSTGRNIDWLPGEGPEGERIYSVGLQNMDYDDTFYTTDENDDSESDSDASIDWGKWMTLGMANGWGKKKSRKGRPSSFTSNHSDKDDSEAHDGSWGQPLKKSVSTGGLIGSSPFRFGPEIERKKQMTGSTGAMFMGRRGSTDKGADPAHRRGSASVDMKPVRMINGRVYGARRASEAAADEAARRRRMEPAFVEWGSSQKGYGSSSTKGGDDDDGGGMAWVKRRREERERKAREAKEAEERAAAAAAAGGDTGGAAGASGEVGPMGESLPPSLVPGGGHGSMSSASSNASDVQPTLSPTTPMERPSDLPPHPDHVEMLNKPDGIQHPAAHDGDHHVVYAVNVPNRKGSEASYASNATGSSHDDDEDEDDEYADDDEEEDVPIDDRCTRAAGVEVMAKHHKIQG